MNGDGLSSRARVEIAHKPMWRVRLGRELPRYLLCGASLLGLAASARFAIAPPRPLQPARSSSTPTVDRAAEGYAVLFARRYLTWNGAEPQASARSLEPFFGSNAEDGTGLELPDSGEQQVQWAEIVQAREAQPGVHVYTVAAQTDSAGLLYLSVAVERVAGGGVRLAGYPAFVGAPAAAPAPAAPERQHEVQEPALRAVVERALRNYLAGSGDELDADLTNGAQVSLPPLGLTLESLQRLDWSEPGSAVLALVQARDERGVQYELAYELDVTRQQGRWELSAVQMDPDS